MKKIFTLILGAAACLAANAQEGLQLLFGPDNIVVEAGKTYETKYTAQDLGGGIFQYTQDAELFLRAEEGYEVTVEVKASSTVQVCSIDGQCTNGTEVVKTGNTGEIPESDVTVDGDFIIADLRIDNIEFDVADLKDITVEVTAYYNDAPDNKVTAKVIMTKEAAGLQGIANDNYYIKVVTGNVLNYNVESQATIAIYTITGKQVARHNVRGNGSINLSGMPRGIYLYNDGHRSGKFIVR